MTRSCRSPRSIRIGIAIAAAALAAAVGLRITIGAISGRGTGLELRRAEPEVEPTLDREPVTTGNRAGFSDMDTNVGDHPDGRVPRYGRFELAFTITDTPATNPYVPYDPSPPPGIEAGTGVSVDLLLLPPGETDWVRALVLPCFYYQPVEELGEGEWVALLPTGTPEWRCRFTPEATGDWRYRVRATDAAGTFESDEGSFDCVPSPHRGFVGISETDTRFFEFADGTPFVTPLINIEQGSPFNTLAGLRSNIRQMGDNGIRFVRWFPTGEGANFVVAPYGDSIHINWRFGAGPVTADGADTARGKRFSYNPYYYSLQTPVLVPGAGYRLSFHAEVGGEQVLRAQVGDLEGGTFDICSSNGRLHTLSGETCAHRNAGWHDYEVIVEMDGASPAPVEVALRGLYAAPDAPAPYNRVREGSLRLHSIRLQRDETGNGDWGANILTRSDPDTFNTIDQQAAAMLDEVLRVSELHGVYHKLTLFHKNDAVLGRFLPDGTTGDWHVKNFYAAEGQAARWYAEAYARYFVGRWSSSTALHSVELANENYLDARAQDAAFALAQVVRDLSPRHLLQSNSFWGWWVESFWTDPERGHLMDYSDKHWYANESGEACDNDGENCELISNVWRDSAAYVRECVHRFDAYRTAYDYAKPIVRGEGGVAMTATYPQHAGIVRDPTGTYYHKKLWAHIGVLGDSCDGEWYPRLFVDDPLRAVDDPLRAVDEDGGTFPNADRDLYQMFAAYERFVAGEPLSNGTHVKIGTDLSGERGIAVRDAVGELRAWGSQDLASERTLLWVDNPAHTWVAMISGAEVPPASATLEIAGFTPGMVYTVEWWDPYATAEALPVASLERAREDGTLALRIEALAHDVAVKIAASPDRGALTNAVLAGQLGGYR